MKPATVQVSFDEERLRAIKQYMGKKDVDLQTELGEVMQRLYEKHVPAPVREYIESRDSDETEKLKKPVRAVVSPANKAGPDGSSHKEDMGQGG